MVRVRYASSLRGSHQGHTRRLDFEFPAAVLLLPLCPLVTHSWNQRTPLPRHQIAPARRERVAHCLAGRVDVHAIAACIQRKRAGWTGLRAWTPCHASGPANARFCRHPFPAFHLPSISAACKGEGSSRPSSQRRSRIRVPGLTALLADMHTYFVRYQSGHPLR
ncbi:hypothetical protein F4780DRAFT_106461 [Xylariomycetidae sp. FL0641]|nr:hypothetical protein F4780DRAFT_106461 [Xylariomycetidae sp. FL0641]